MGASCPHVNTEENCFLSLLKTIWFSSIMSLSKIEEAKRAAAYKAVDEHVKDGMVRLPNSDFKYHVFLLVSFVISLQTRGILCRQFLLSSSVSDV